MFARKLWREIAIRVVSITMVLMHTLVPIPVTMMSVSEDQIAIAPHSLIDIQGTRGSSDQPHSASERSGIVFQDNTPVASPQATGTSTSTPEPTLTPTATPAVESTVTTATPTAAPETAIPLSPTTSQTATLAPTVTAGQPSALSFHFSAFPEQAGPGDDVTFMVDIENQGQTPVTGLLFSNILPEDLGNAENGFKDFEYDPQTRRLTWDGAKAGIPSLAPGQKISLAYTVKLATLHDEVSLIDSASLDADGLPEELWAEAGLTLLLQQKQMTVVDQAGGKARGLNGKVEINVPEKALKEPRGLLIKDLITDLPAGKNEPWLKFALEMQVPKPEDTQILQERDRIVPMETVEAQFDQPVELIVSLEGTADLSILGADQTPFLVTLDEASGTWVRVPLESVDRESNTVTADIGHFSTWGVGLGSSFPQNGANVVLFDTAYPSLFTGNSDYSIPLWVPPGRNGMQPDLTLSYSSGTANGVLGDIQSSWVGMGWNIDSVEIARKITNGSCSPCGGDSYGYENKFMLLINGTGYELIVDANDPRFYHTKPESFMIIKRNNILLGPNYPTPINATGEWWEVREKDGKEWRLGWTPESEQLAAMKGYPGYEWTPTSSGWGTLGYAGDAKDRVAIRWRADRLMDTYGNTVSFTYQKETRQVNGTSVNYDRASYLYQISYTNSVIYPLYHGYTVVFERESRGGVDLPSTPTDWDNWDSERLDRIDIYYDLSRIVREYRLDYEDRFYSDDGKTWQTTTLKAVTTSGMRDRYTVDVAPSIMFTYSDYNNRASHTGWQEWAYPRLTTISNGWGGTATYTYANDGRLDTSWYNWHVTTLDIADGVNINPMKTSFAYSTPCYKVMNPPDDWTCNGTNVGELVGYEQTTATTKDFNGTTTLASSVHQFYTERKKAGREYEVQNRNASGTTLSKTTTNITVIDFSNGAYFTYPDMVENFLLSSTLERVNRTTYSYDSVSGNLLEKKEYDGSLVLYRETDFEYLMNTNWSVWLLDTLSKQTLKDGNGAVISQQEYGYNGYLPGSGWTTTAKPDLNRIVDGTQTIDTTYHYDNYGNRVETRLYENFGTTNSLPSGSYNSYVTSYEDDGTTNEDTNLQTYPTSLTDPLGHVTRTHYDYGTGRPTEVTDPNGKKTTTTYDGLGRILEVKYHGYDTPNIIYTYPELTPGPVSYTYDVPAPFAVKMEILDESTSPFVYRSAWQVMDGLGRVIQTQAPDDTAGSLILTDISYDARGKTLYGGLPRTVSITGETYSYFAPSWGSVPHTTSAYDALGRPLSITYPDGTTESWAYFGLRTGMWDRNNHKTVKQNDGFGRLERVEEWSGTALQGGDSTGLSLYAATQYEYDARDLLKQVTDAAGNQTTINYDGFGRKIEMTDPDLGNWRYRYNALGNLTAQIDAKRQAVNMYYDDLGRLIGKTYDNGPVPADYQPLGDPGYAGYTVKYYYDAEPNGYGRRTSMVDGSGTTTWTYNALGQAVNETRNIESVDYSLSTTFDAFGRPLTQNLPSTENLTYSYNAMGALSGLSGTNTYVSQIHYNANGQVEDQVLGSNLVQQYCYDSTTLRMTSLRVYPGALQSCVTTPSNPRLNFSYSYQANGNISQILDPVRGEMLNYTYDELDRLLSVNGSYNQNYSYDMTGNMTSKGMPSSPGTTGLAAWWDMDQVSGTRSDSYGSNHLTDNNTVASSASLRGNAASFVPANLESLSIADNTALSTGDIDFTLAATVYLNSTANTMVIANKGLQSSSTRDYILYYDVTGSKFKFSVGNGTVSGTVSSQETISAGRWYTILAWHDSAGNTLNLQVNNGSISTANYSSGALDTTYPLTIGAHSGGVSGIDGKIDQMALYKRVLTPNERIWMYNNGMGRSYADLVTSNPGTTNLMAWWSMNETGGARNDSHGSNHLTDNNTVGSEPGLQGNAASFVTANLEYLSIADNAALSTNDIDFTLAANVYLDSTSNIMILANKGLAGSSVRDFILYFDPGTSKFIFSVGNGTVSGSVSSLETITAGRWYTVAAWHNSIGNTLNIQVNNATVSTASYSGGAMDTAYPLTIGAHNGGASAMNGQIDEVLLYKRILTSGERAWLYNNGLGRTYADLNASTQTAGSTFTYGDPGPVHAVSSLSTGETYAYDANGNMTCRVEGGITYKQDYNIENMLVAVSKMSGSCTTGTVLETTSFVYDGDGSLVKKINPDGSRTIYVGGIYEVDKDPGETVTHTRVYYPAGGAMRIDGTLYYVLKDHLGSASVVTEADGDPVAGAEARYYPFGEARFSTSSMLTDKLYTGQREMADLGLYHYNARFYSPYINHFLSADTIVPDPYSPQSLNRYSYVVNNPINAIDPTGHLCVGEPEECLEDDGTTGSGFTGTGGTVSNPGAGNCTGSACQGNDGDDNDDDVTPEVTLDPNSGDEDDNEYFCFTHPSSCDININPNAIVDPLAWTHIAEGILGGVVLFGVGDLLIGAGAFVCTSVVGCIAGAPVILAGVLAYPVGVGFIYYGVQSGEIYLDEIIEVSILSED